MTTTMKIQSKSKSLPPRMKQKGSRRPKGKVRLVMERLQVGQWFRLEAESKANPHAIAKAIGITVRCYRDETGLVVVQRIT